MIIIKVYAESAKGGEKPPRLVSTPVRPTSEQGQWYDKVGGSYLGGPGYGRPPRTTFIPPNPNRGR